ncbi:Spore germination protein [Amphibacillus marinus]|uniref:Spore germination protein n=1 Tax=Amphibacillus marinus TaxID=872970 RepID=A0A1H8Q1G4_9BACI|nr:endospore germination permease [Amphibacillus marinus]SEO47916.1 Spore germination protein [Amphibacillus marinus]
MTEKISSKQFLVLVFMNLLGTSIVFIPSIATSYGQENGWITVLISTIIGMVLILLFNATVSNDDTLDFFSAIDQSVGKIIGNVIIGALIIFAYYTGIANIWALSEFVGLQILMGTPPAAIALISTMTSLIAVRYGIEVIARSIEIFFPFTILSLVLLALLVWPEARLENIEPIMQLNKMSTVIGAIPLVGMTFLEVITLVIILSSVNNRKDGKRAFLYGGLLAGFCMMIVTFASIAVLGVQGTVRHTYPIYVLGQNIRIAQFFERIEVLVAFIWFFTIFFKIATTNFIIVKAVQHLFKLKRHQSISIPVSFLLWTGSVTSFPNVFYDFEAINSTYLVLGFIVGFLIPLFIVVSKKISQLRKT